MEGNGRSGRSGSSGKRSNGMNEKNRTILVTVIVTTIVVIIILSLLALWQYNSIDDHVINELSKAVRDACLSAEEIVYRHTLELPEQIDVYDKRLATTLWDIGGAVSEANCREIPLPPGFTARHIIYSDKLMIAYIFSNAQDACIAFTGTYFPQHWFNNLKISLVVPVALGVADGGEDGVKLHKGFYNLYASVRDEIKGWLETHHVRDLYITGRSMGGALSTVCMYDMTLNRFCSCENVVHYSFAAPRVGNITFAKDYDARVSNSFRVHNTEDVVVGIPPAVSNNFLPFSIASLGLTPGENLLYQHVGKAKAFTKNESSVYANHVEAYYDLPE
jgi:predicted lipase